MFVRLVGSPSSFAPVDDIRVAHFRCLLVTLSGTLFGS